MTPHAKLDDFVAPPCTAEIRILYRDEDILLIDKPSGLLSLSGALYPPYGPHPSIAYSQP